MINNSMARKESAQLDQRIGVLASCAYYAFVNGYDRPETIGTLAQVQRALRLADKSKAKMSDRLWTVVLRFEYPAWDEADGIVYSGIEAWSKSEAISQARHLAVKDGHTIGGGKGRYWFKAQEAGLAE